ncbi:CgeB family protein [Rhizobium paknamense]|uniref:Spore maturation protein CgeB n=1 Tax=Rhizobium paknamense TaxID=1206817 RepID=A0ABU0IHV6_9HYPH|nr:glycosyltransferase [Rhizobium paknamense]MDQ0457846.1 spore maturation protein CgeB [Rhizobium paknamense]
MKFLFYTHSLMSDWNHGNAHFLRGIMKNLQARGHTALALEPKVSWSRENLLADAGPGAITAFHADFPDLRTEVYDVDFDHEEAVGEADVVIVHEWTEPQLIARLGRARRTGNFTLLFHDTHHRAVSAGEDIAAMDLRDYDGVLAFGETLRQRYLKAGWGRNVFTWHEAADETLFHPHPDRTPERDLVWIGNWGDDERSRELMEFLIEPVAHLKLSARVHGVRYPDDALAALSRAGIDYRGWIANAAVPEVFAAHRFTIHVPRRPYVEHLPGIPTIRVFEALACGIPLISAPWEYSEQLFTPGRDFLFASDGKEMQALMQQLLADDAMRRELSEHGLRTIRERHTCAHRVEQLLDILAVSGTKRVRDQILPKEAAE